MGPPVTLTKRSRSSMSRAGAPDHQLRASRVGVQDPPAGVRTLGRRRLTNVNRSTTDPRRTPSRSGASHARPTGVISGSSAWAVRRAAEIRVTRLKDLALRRAAEPALDLGALDWRRGKDEVNSAMRSGAEVAVPAMFSAA